MKVDIVKMIFLSFMLYEKGKEITLMESRFRSWDTTPTPSRPTSPRNGDTTPRANSPARDSTDNKNHSSSPTRQERRIKDLWLHTHKKLQQDNPQQSPNITDHNTIRSSWKSNRTTDYSDDSLQPSIIDIPENISQEKPLQQWDEFKRQSSQRFRDTGELALSDWKRLKTDLENLQDTFNKVENLWSTYYNDNSFFLHSKWGDSPQFRYQMMQQDYQSNGSISTNRITKRYEIEPMSVIRTLQYHTQIFCDRFAHYTFWDETAEIYLKTCIDDYIDPLIEKVKKMNADISLIMSRHNFEEWEKTFKEPHDSFEKIKFCLDSCTEYIEDAIKAY